MQQQFEILWFMLSLKNVIFQLILYLKKLFFNHGKIIIYFIKVDQTKKIQALQRHMS